MFKKSTLTDYLASFVLAGSVLVNPACIFADDKQPVQETSIDHLTQAEVDRLMLRENVDEILKEEYESGRIQKVTYDATEGRTNFRELVYQDNLPAKDRKPVLMLVADADGKGWFDKEKYAFDKCDAIITKNLAQKYSDFRIVFYDPSIDAEFNFNDGSTKYGDELDREGILAMPSIFLYGLFDLTNGETSNSNNRSVKKLDILRGAPTNLKGIITLYKDLDVDWLSTNVTNPNGKYVWRMQNKGIKWTKIKYS